METIKFDINSQHALEANGQDEITKHESITGIVTAPPSATVRRAQLFSSFLEACIPFKYENLTPETTWLFDLPVVQAPTSALERAMCALCLASLGRRYDDRTLHHESLHHYTKALALVQSALRDPIAVYYDATLATCMALIMYEVLACPQKSPSAYATHLDGCAKLVQLRGPETYDGDLAHSLFLTHRLQKVRSKLFSFLTCILSDVADELYSVDLAGQREGLSNLFMYTRMDRTSVAKSGKRPLDRILDLLALGTTLQQRGACLQYIASDEMRLREVHALIQDCWEIDGKLDDIAQLLRPGIQTRTYEPEVNETAEMADEEVIPITEPSFADLATAKTVLLLWSLQAMLWSGMVSLYNDLAIAGSFETLSGEISIGWPPLSHRINWIEKVHDVVASLSFCLQPENGLLGPWAIVAPLGIVNGLVHGKSQFEAESRAILDALKCVNNRGLPVVGSAIPEHI